MYPGLGHSQTPRRAPPLPTAQPAPWPSLFLLPSPSSPKPTGPTIHLPSHPCQYHRPITGAELPPRASPGPSRPALPSGVCSCQHQPCRQFSSPVPAAERTELQLRAAPPHAMATSGGQTMDTSHGPPSQDSGHLCLGLSRRRLPTRPSCSSAICAKVTGTRELPDWIRPACTASAIPPPGAAALQPQ